MKNVKELRKTASKVIDSLMNGSIDSKNAKVVVAGMNTMISSAKAQIVHYKAMGKKSKINFLITD
jgi:hypothetical protein